MKAYFIAWLWFVFVGLVAGYVAFGLCWLFGIEPTEWRVCLFVLASLVMDLKIREAQRDRK